MTPLHHANIFLDSSWFELLHVRIHNQNKRKAHELYVELIKERNTVGPSMRDHYIT